MEPFLNNGFNLAIWQSVGNKSGYAMSYKAEVVDKKDLIVQVEASKSSIKDLFNDLLNETRGFKCQITVKALLKNTDLMVK